MRFKRAVFTGGGILLIVTVLYALVSYRFLGTELSVVLEKAQRTNNAKAWINGSMNVFPSKDNITVKQPSTKSTTIKPATMKASTKKPSTIKPATMKASTKKPSTLKITTMKATTKTATATRETATSKTTPTPKPVKLVLFYTPMWGHVPWQHLKNTHDTHAFTHVDGKKTCNVTNCRISYDKKDLAKSDAVLFHARDMPSLSTLNELSKNRNKNQRWVFWTYENPYYVWLEMDKYDNLFNWTMTYRRDSDIFRPYGSYRLLSPSERPSKKDLKNYAQGKDKLVGWMVSNCRSHRKTITAKLMKFGIDVTVLGKCGLQFGQNQPCDLGPNGCSSILKRFKFYLSFENLNCVDYITEKYWLTPFHYEMIPIVFGPRNYDPKIAVPGSYINVRDYSSIKDLADYLKYLDKNDTAYNEYFQWKLKYKLDDTNPWNCQMCQLLNNPNLPRKVYANLSTYWGEKTTCENTEEIVNKL